MPTPTPRRPYGWRPDLPDHRDLVYRAPPRRRGSPLPAHATEIIDKLGPVYDQGPLGSCVLNTNVAQVEYATVQGGFAWEMLSRLYPYYWGRVKEGTVGQDAGLQIRTGLKVLVERGSPPETLWPYTPARLLRRPTAPCDAAAALRQVLRYARVPRDLATLKRTLAPDPTAARAGWPISFGFTVYESYESDEFYETGLMRAPGPREKALGGHAALLVGYDDRVVLPGESAPGALLCRNSWGPDFGLKDRARPELRGHWWMPYSLARREGFLEDFWVVYEVEGRSAKAA